VIYPRAHESLGANDALSMQVDDYTGNIRNLYLPNQMYLL